MILPIVGLVITVAVLVFIIVKALRQPPVFDKKSKEQLKGQFKELVTSFEALPAEDKQKMSGVAERALKEIHPQASYILTGKKDPPPKEEPKKPEEKKPPDLWT